MENIIAICSDSVETLHSCDVYRALHEAKQCKVLGTFVPWLIEKRPDLEDTIKEDYVEIMSEVA